MSAARVGGAVFLGLLVGALPAYGVPTAIVAIASVWLGLDAILAWLASNADTPLLVHAVRSAEARSGVLPVAIVLALAGGGVAYGVAFLLVPRAARPAYRLPDHAPGWVHAVERVAARYGHPRSPSPWDRLRFHRVRGKLLADPAARLVAELGGEGEHSLGSVLDVGAGWGQLALFLLELGRACVVRGLDWDRRKIDAAVRAASGDAAAHALAGSFAVGDVREAPLEPADTVLLVDLLHYFRPEEQDALLDRAAAAVLPGGRIFVREADPERGLRSWVTRLEEALFTSLAVNRGERVRFRPALELVRRLEASGLECEVIHAWGGTPFSNVLIVGRRGGGTHRASSTGTCGRSSAGP